MGIRYKKIISLIFVLVFSAVFLSANYSLALTTGLDNAFKNDSGSPLQTVAEQGAHYNTSATFGSIIGQILTMALGLLGVIFLILAIYGGYNWMMARGNEEMVENAKKTLTNAILGLIIVLAAFVISRFIIGSLGELIIK